MASGMKYFIESVKSRVCKRSLGIEVSSYTPQIAVKQDKLHLDKRKDVR
jgi:hypothetical protein